MDLVLGCRPSVYFSLCGKQSHGRPMGLHEPPAKLVFFLFLQGSIPGFLHLTHSSVSLPFFAPHPPLPLFSFPFFPSSSYTSAVSSSQLCLDTFTRHRFWLFASFQTSLFPAVSSRAPLVPSHLFLLLHPDPCTHIGPFVSASSSRDTS